ncbi:MAG TPA: hypothetical protein PKD91_01425, partial [Bacteroidia bacterium]|nr:hypothetical protein [Bacteroidia bacterium]
MGTISRRIRQPYGYKKEAALKNAKFGKKTVKSNPEIQIGFRGKKRVEIRYNLLFMRSIKDFFEIALINFLFNHFPESNAK